MAATNTLEYTRIPRFNGQDDYKVWYMDVLDTGRLAVAGGRIINNSNLFTKLFKFDDSQEIPLLKHYFSKEFTELNSVWQSVCLLDDRLCLMCFKEKIALYDINNDGKPMTLKLGGTARCMTTRDGLVYVGLERSEEVIVYDTRESKLSKQKTITLTGIEGNWPKDISVSNNKLFICTHTFGRAYMYNIEGKMEHIFKNPPERYADSITVSEEKGLIFILWNAADSQVVVYSLSWRHRLASFEAPNGSKRIRINNNINSLILVTGETGITGNVCEYHTLQSYIFTFDKLLKFVESLTESLTVKNHCLELIEHCEVPAIKPLDIIQSDAPLTTLIHHLRGAQTVSDDDISHLMTACSDKELRKLRAVKQLTQLTLDVLKDQREALENKRQELSDKLTKSEDENQQLRDELKTLKDKNEELLQQQKQASPTKPHPPWRISLAYDQSTFQYLSDIFTFDSLLKFVKSLNEKNHCQELIDDLGVPAEESLDIITSGAPFSCLFHHLIKAGMVSVDAFSRLMTACFDKELRKLRAVKQLTQLTIDVFKDQREALEKRTQELSDKLAESKDGKKQLRQRLKTLKEENEALLQQQQQASSASVTEGETLPEELETLDVSQHSTLAD